MSSIASITIGTWRLLHPHLKISATGTDPDETDFAEWIAWADGKILAYLQVPTLPTDIGNIMKNVADDLLFRKWTLEKLVKSAEPNDLQEVPQPELTPENKEDLDSLKGQDESIEDPAFNFDLDTIEGGFD